jgi:hypothetical protein
MNIGVPDLSKKSYMKKTIPYKKFKNLRPHKNEKIRAKSDIAVAIIGKR